MDGNAVIFKGTVNGLTIILKQDSSFNEIIECMTEKVKSAGKFFRGAKLAVRYKGRILGENEKQELYQLLVKESGAQIMSFDEEIVDTNIKVNTPTNTTDRSKQFKKYMFFKGIDEGQTKFYRGTVRSGQMISFDGNLVVLGDVNPGGVIEATGNVVVMGLLRGIVHAGSDGNKEAIVAALGLNPTQLRIGDVITRSPDENTNSVNLTPELAYIKDDVLLVERFLPQR